MTVNGKTRLCQPSFAHLSIPLTHTHEARRHGYTAAHLVEVPEVEAGGRGAEGHLTPQLQVDRRELAAPPQGIAGRAEVVDIRQSECKYLGDYETLARYGRMGRDFFSQTM